jgi:DNA polymerase III delta prime subunit
LIHRSRLTIKKKVISITNMLTGFRVKDNLWYRGILLSGPPGTGKTSLATSCAYDEGVNLFTINGPEIISQYYGESEQALYDVFSSAKQAAPAVVRLSNAFLHFFHHVNYALKLRKFASFIVLVFHLYVVKLKKYNNSLW